MAIANGIAPYAPISEEPEVVSAANQRCARQHPSSVSVPTTLSEFKQMLRQDRQLASRLAADQDRLRSIASSLLQTDEDALELYADVEMLAAYLRAMINERMRPTWLI